MTEAYYKEHGKSHYISANEYAEGDNFSRPWEVYCNECDKRLTLVRKSFGFKVPEYRAFNNWRHYKGKCGESE